MGLFGKGGSHDHDSIIERLREIKRFLLGREPSLVSQIDQRLDAVIDILQGMENTITLLQALEDADAEALARLEAQVQAILDAVGQPDEDLVATVTFGSPSPKIPDGLLTAGPAPRPKFPTAHIALAAHAKRHHSHLR